MTTFGDRALPVDLVPRPRPLMRVGPVSELPPGTVKGVGQYAVGNVDGEYFAVSRSCRHLLGDLAKGSIDAKGCLVCPVHGSRGVLADDGLDRPKDEGRSRDVRAHATRGERPQTGTCDGNPTNWEIQAQETGDAQQGFVTVFIYTVRTFASGVQDDKHMEREVLG